MVAKSRPQSFDPDRPDFAPYGLTCVRWSPSKMRWPDHHNEVELNFLESGSLTYLLGGKKTVVKAGKLSVFWAAIPHQVIDFSDETAYFVATIPLHTFLQWRLPEAFLKPLMQGRFFSERTTAQAGSDTDLFARWTVDLQEKSAILERTVLLELQARLIRLALQVPKRRRSLSKNDGLSTLTAVGLNKVERMACFIAEHYTEKLTVQQIGAFVELHPNYAMNLFQKTFGTTLIKYLTQHRVSHAQRLLATTQLTVREIAYQSGFLSISRFNDAFSHACGCSPREYRKAHALA